MKTLDLFFATSLLSESLAGLRFWKILCLLGSRDQKLKYHRYLLSVLTKTCSHSKWYKPHSPHFKVLKIGTEHWDVKLTESSSIQKAGVKTGLKIAYFGCKSNDYLDYPGTASPTPSSNQAPDLAERRKVQKDRTRGDPWHQWEIREYEPDLQT